MKVKSRMRTKTINMADLLTEIESQYVTALNANFDLFAGDEFILTESFHDFGEVMAKIELLEYMQFLTKEEAQRIIDYFYNYRSEMIKNRVTENKED